MKLNTKLLPSIIGSLIISSICLTWFIVREVDTNLEEIYNKTMQSNLNARQSLLNDFIAAASYHTLEFTINPDLKNYLQQDDSDKITTEITKLFHKKDAKFDTVVVMDANGKIVSEVYNAENLKVNTEGKWGLSNINIVGILQHQEFLYIHAEHPIIKDGVVIGALITGSDIFSDNNFANSIREKLSIETTSFLGDMIYASTIKDKDGKSLKGTKMEDQAILRSVLENGESLSMRININNQNYNSVYNPILDINGKIIGMSFSAVSTAERDKTLFEIFKLSIIVCAVIIMLFTIINILWVRYILVTPLKSLTSLSHQLTNWDLTKTVAIKTKDELGELATSMSDFVTHIRGVIFKLKEQAETINKSSAELTTVANSMLEGNTEATNKLDETCADIEEMNCKYTTAQKSLESVSSSIVTISAAAEEMTATIGEIAGNSSNARSVTSEASEEATKTQGIIKDLGQAAQEISTVTESISNISAQTNILALNATIEAARAGTAGKGFAVVANEIKNLAQETESATGNIHGKVNDIQSSTNVAVNNVESVTNVINNVNNLVTNIAAAIEEQSAVTKDISHNIGGISNSIKDSNETIFEFSQIAKKVTDQVHVVSQITEENTTGSAQIKASADNLALLSEELEKTIAQFKL
ncbi:MAG: methyl-accepting chemotaxis protein [Deltaproteobacteria bacterium]|jgi:methyl-accepting chemotaxis protein|nr:methyl-accepting chemotaxis protein [Deltaproteobacteria bacterium]